MIFFVKIKKVIVFLSLVKRITANYIILVIILLSAFNLQSRPIVAFSEEWVNDIDSLPKIFMIGQNAESYEKLISKATSLLQVCQNDVYLAYEKWLHMLGDLEATAQQLGISLKSTKFWFSVNWNPDGTIQHFAYYPKPGSVNISETILVQLLETFVANYRLPIHSEMAFHNYGSVAFPIPVRKQMASKNIVKP